jgi:hypothetical protein
VKAYLPQKPAPEPSKLGPNLVALGILLAFGLLVFGLAQPAEQRARNAAANAAEQCVYNRQMDAIEGYIPSRC